MSQAAVERDATCLAFLMAASAAHSPVGGYVLHALVPSSLPSQVDGLAHWMALCHRPLLITRLLRCVTGLWLPGRIAGNAGGLKVLLLVSPLHCLLPDGCGILLRHRRSAPPR